MGAQTSPPGLEVTFPLMAGMVALLFFLLAFLAHRTAAAGGAGGRAMRQVSHAALLLAGFSLAVTLLEGVFRVLVPGGYFHFRPVEPTSAGAVLEPLPDGQAYWEYHGAWGFDERGGREGYPAAEDPSLRMTVLGDSVTYGVRVPYERSFPYLLARQLEARLGPVALTNLAVPGFSTLQERIILERKGLDPRPDLVLLGVFSNDLAQYTIVGGTAYDIRVKEREGLPVFDLFPLPDAVNRFLVTHSVFYQFLTLRGMAAYDKASGRELGQVAAAMAEMERIRELVHGVSARLVVVLLPMLDRDMDGPEDEHTAHFYGEIRRWAAPRGVPLMDLRPLLAGYDARALRIDECCHLSSYGHEVVAGLLAERLGTIAW